MVSGDYLAGWIEGRVSLAGSSLFLAAREAGTRVERCSALSAFSYRCTPSWVGCVAEKPLFAVFGESVWELVEDVVNTTKSGTPPLRSKGLEFLHLGLIAGPSCLDALLHPGIPRRPEARRFVSGHDFSRAENCTQQNIGLLAPA